MTSAPDLVLADELRRVPLFADLDEETLAWVGAQCRVRELESGDVLFHAGEPAEDMHIMLEGMVQARRDAVAPDIAVFTMRTGEIGGVIPFSRMIAYAATGRATTRSRVALLPKSRFPELLRRAPSLEARFVALIADRVRETTQRDQQIEKLSALGKLSAGLAHELNNPAAAARRSAAELRRRLDVVAQQTEDLIAAGIQPSCVRRLNEVRLRVGGADRPALDSLARSDREEQFAAWLESLGVSEPWIAAGTFVDAGMTVAELDAALADGTPAQRVAAIGWLESALAADALVGVVSHASTRISELIGTIKQFTQMDRAASPERLDLAASIETALALLAHRIKERHIVVTRDYAPDVPKVLGFAGELGQVWTNLLDNAVDAAPDGGAIVVRTARDGRMAVIEIRDNGAGIPDAVLARIWDPFFTTKPTGQGTGLGLDIVRRIVTRTHCGDVAVASQPGDTRFTVRLPVDGPPRE